MRNWQAWPQASNVENRNDLNSFSSLGGLLSNAWATSPAMRVAHTVHRLWPDFNQQQWASTHLPANLPTTPLRDPSNPQGATTWNESGWSNPSFGGAQIPPNENRQPQPIGPRTNPSLYDLNRENSVSFGGAQIPQTPQEPQDIGPLTDPWRWYTPGAQ